MKKFKVFVTAVILLSIALVAGTALAGIEPGTYSLSPRAGWYVFDGDEGLKDALVIDVGLGYNFTNRIGAEFVGSYVETEEDTHPVVTRRGGIYRIDGLYNIMPDKRISPYVALGIGVITHDTTNLGNESGLLVNGGGGINLFITKDIALRGDARYIKSYYDNFGDNYNNFVYTFGITYLFGGKAKEIAPAPAPSPAPAPAPKPVPAPPKDSDGDGVIDDLDKCPGTLAGITVDKNGCPVPLKEKVSIDLKVEFDFDKAEIKSVYNEHLQKVANFLITYPEASSVIEGHTDSTGTDEYNLKLSQKRTENVKQYLINNFGINQSRLTSEGFGESKPIADNKTKEGRQKNRRVTAVISATAIKY
jgi:OOP family OmpA-OmpF porin